MSKYLDKLSPIQYEAATNFSGATLIIAGAGSGKTRVLTYRIAYMLEQGISSHNILALTFTNKAAKEMRERIEQIVPAEKARRLWMGTFHSIFARILRSEADKLGYPSSFTIYDTADSKNVVKAVIKDLNLSDETYKVNDIYSRISLAKNNLATPESYEANATLMAEDRERRRPQFIEIYKQYARRCKEYGAMDFDDLLLNTNILFRDFPDVLARYQEQFRYIMVDEYQDTNTAQYLIVKKIADKYRNICVVGDDAQSIYSFRGAKIENILRFQTDYPDVKIFKLEQNYRSTQNIVNAANSIIEKNKRQLKKKSFSANDAGEKIRLYKAYTDKEEALIVASDIRSLQRRGVDFADVAVLYRTNAQSRAIEESLRRVGIPYKIYGGQSFYQRKEIKDVLAYIRLAVNYKDDEALKRIINYPARGIGDVTLGKIAATAEKHGVSMYEVIDRLTPQQMELSSAAGKKIKDFAAMIGEFGAAVHTTPAYEMGLAVATRSGIIGNFRMQQTPEATSVLENIDELLNSIAAYAKSRSEEEPENTLVTIDEWLQNVSLLTDMDSDKDSGESRVTMMTVHSAKGLEFDYVYIVGLEETLFPSLMCSDSLEGLEEERRLFYVALTRARKGAILTFSDTRFRWGDMTSNRPSRFIGEIDSAYIEAQSAESEEPAPAPRPAYRERTFERSAERPAAQSTPRHTYTPPASQLPNMKSIGRRDAASTVHAATGDIKTGSKVEHEKFGRGTVIQLEQTPNGAKAVVVFDSAGEKTLLLKYAKLRVVD